MLIRPLDPNRDLDRYLRILHQSEPFPRSPAEWHERQALAPAGAFRRFLVGEVEGEIVAVGALLDHEMMANALTGRLVVDAAHRGRGHGAEMAAALDHLVAGRAPDHVDVRVGDGDAGSRAWAERRGFRLAAHMIRSRLDLSAFDPAAHRGAVERAETAGFRIGTATGLDRLYDLYAELVPDAPDGLRPRSHESFLRSAERRPGPVLLVAARGPVWAGLAIADLADPDGAFNEFTGVLRAHRGQGVATALKVLAAAELVRLGRRWVETSNHAGNAPMLAVNRALGYRPVYGTFFLRRPGRGYPGGQVT